MNTAVPNPLRQLANYGQSVWLDDIRRVWLDDGTFARLISEDGVVGVTSNPAIFAKAIAGHEYDVSIRELTTKGLQAEAVYETLVLQDVQRAADMLRPTYEATGGTDGFVSLEVSPHLANDADGTVREALRLWQAFNRPNAMIKIPATHAGIVAIRTVLTEGVNVNVTLLFSLDRYREVVNSFLDGLEERLAAGHTVDRIASVASFFISRIDTVVDGKLDTLGTPQAKALRGCAAIAAAELAYEIYKEWINGERWQRLVKRGARSQRLLWASTSTKDPHYVDVKYAEALIASQTVNTLPYATLEAYRDHGQPARRLGNAVERARNVWAELHKLGIDMKTVSDRLEQEGVRKFVEPFDELHAALRRR